MRLKAFYLVALFGACLPVSGQIVSEGEGGAFPEVHVRHQHICFDFSDCAPVPPGLVAWYSFEPLGNGGEADVDMHTRHSTGYDKGGVEHSPGIVGEGLELNGADSYVEIIGAPAFDPPTQGFPRWTREIDFFGDEFSLAVWFKTSDTTSPVSPLLDRREERADGNQGYALFLDNQGQPGFQLASPGRFPEDIDSSTWTVDTRDLRDDQWHHLVVSIYRGGEGMFYVDGELALTFDTEPYANRNLETFAPLLIGRHMDGSSFWNGLIDEVMIFQKVLDDAAVKSLRRIQEKPLCTC